MTQVYLKETDELFFCSICSSIEFHELHLTHTGVSVIEACCNSCGMSGLYTMDGEDMDLVYDRIRSMDAWERRVMAIGVCD